MRSAGDSSLCLACHKDKNPSIPASEGWGGHPVNVEPDTASIPRELLNKGANLGQAGRVVCITCHVVHGNESGQESLLVASPAGSALCTGCHGDKLALLESGHDLAASAPSEKNQEGQTASQGGPCSPCHLPHGSARKLLGDGDLGTEICISCHSRKKVAYNPRLEGYRHPLGVDGPDGSVECDSCHDPHRASPLSKDDAASASDDREALFLRARLPDLCIACHDQQGNVVGSGHDLRETAPREVNIDGRTAAATGACGACHELHSELPGARWARDLAEDEAVEHLCLNCHQEGEVAEDLSLDGGPSHAMGVSPTSQGLETTLPLVEDTSSPNTRLVIACTTCHDPHVWSQAQPTPADPFEEGDASTSFLRLRNSPEPLLCVDCHGDESLVSGTEHDLIFVAPSSRNSARQLPMESGTCGVCHAVHNAVDASKLWGRTLPTESSGNKLADYCGSCHGVGGAAREKIPQTSLHPQYTLVNLGRTKKDRPGYFPLFDSGTGEKVGTGSISCPSCHNVHRWSVGQQAPGDGVNREGDAMNSFLRSESRQMPCMNCHGTSALYLYKYFHRAGSRRSSGVRPDRGDQQ